MRALILTGWMLLPVGFGLWHYGPGQAQMQLDEVGKLLAKAEAATQARDWAGAVEHYSEALKKLPSEHTREIQPIRVELNLARMNAGMLPEAHNDLKILVDELQTDDTTDARTLARARQTLAQSQFYMTWLMRLEGLPREMWEPEIEASRQTYRLLAEQAEARGDQAGTESSQQDLESAVRLARMELSELQGLALPCQCKGCCSGKCKGRSMKQAKGKAEDARGASSGPPPDGSGH